MPRERRSQRSAALYKRVVTAGNRTVRVALYPPREDQTTGVTLGIGYANPEAFSKIFFEVTDENWAEVNKAVREALRLSKHPELAQKLAESEKAEKSKKKAAKTTTRPRGRVKAKTGAGAPSHPNTGNGVSEQTHEAQDSVVAPPVRAAAPPTAMRQRRED